MVLSCGHVESDEEWCQQGVLTKFPFIPPCFSVPHPHRWPRCYTSMNLEGDHRRLPPPHHHHRASVILMQKEGRCSGVWVWKGPRGEGSLSHHLYFFNQRVLVARVCEASPLLSSLSVCQAKVCARLSSDKPCQYTREGDFRRPWWGVARVGVGCRSPLEATHTSSPPSKVDLVH